MCSVLNVFSIEHGFYVSPNEKRRFRSFFLFVGEKTVFTTPLTLLLTFPLTSLTSSLRIRTPAPLTPRNDIHKITNRWWPSYWIRIPAWEAPAVQLSWVVWRRDSRCTSGFPPESSRDKRIPHCSKCTRSAALCRAALWVAAGSRQPVLCAACPRCGPILMTYCIYQ